MTSRDHSPRAKKSISLSVMLGTLLVPVGAYAASALVQSSAVAERTSLSEPPPGAGTPAVESPSISTDLGTACGEAGLAMVADETTGSMSEIQQAALDALRDVCSGEGMDLPDPVGSRPVAASDTEPAPASPAPVSDVVMTSSDDDDREGDHGRHGGDDRDDDDEHGRHGDDDEDDHHGGDDE